MGSAGQNGFHDTALARAPGVVLGRSGASFGIAHFCKEDFWPHNTALYVTDFFDNDPHFTYYFLKSIDFTRHNSGGAQQSLNRNFIGPIRVAIPSRPEQEIIARALSDADDLIEGLESLIAKKRAIKQGVMQELLTGKRRLPGFKGEWLTKRLGEVGDSLIGLTYAPTDVREHGVLVLRSSNIQEGALRFDDNVFVKVDLPDKLRVRSGDILICVRNGSRDLIGKCAKIDSRCDGMTFGAFMAVFRTPCHDF